nr:MAG TPA: hypothetical protein [Caudoviricetes sp.]
MRPFSFRNFYLSIVDKWLLPKLFRNFLIFS